MGLIRTVFIVCLGISGISCDLVVPKTALQLWQKSDQTKLIGDGETAVQSTDPGSAFYLRTTEPSRDVPLLDGSVHRVDSTQLMDSGAVCNKANSYFSSGGGWCAGANNIDQWIQVNLGRMFTIAAIATKGRGDYSQWVTSYHLAFSSSDSVFEFYTEDGTIKDFTGNSDRNTVIRHTLRNPVDTSQVKLHPVTWSVHISLRWELYGYPPNGEEPLINGGMYRVLDAQLTASTTYGQYGTQYSRLHETTGSKGWSAGVNDVNQWIQVDFGRLVSVAGVATQGRGGSSQYVTSYYLTFSSDSSTFSPYQEKGETKIFAGNIENTQVVMHELASPMVASQARLHPVTWNWQISTRWEFYGENHIVTGEEALMNGGVYGVLDTQLTASTINGTCPIQYCRLHKTASGGGWCAAVTDVNQWIQVELGRLVTITAVSTQGLYSNSQWVTSYKLSIGSSHFAPYTHYMYMENGQVKIFNGNSDSNTVVTNRLAVPAVGSQVRLHPVTWYGHISLRWEVHGYPATTILLESVRNPGKFLRHGGFVMHLRSYGGTAHFMYNMHPNPDGSVWFSSLNFPTHRIGWSGSTYMILEGHGQEFESDGSFFPVEVPKVYKQDYFVKKTGVRMTSNITLTTSVVRRSQCSQFCLLVSDCMGFGFNTTAGPQGRHDCELVSGIPISKSANIMGDPSWDTHYKDVHYLPSWQ